MKTQITNPETGYARAIALREFQAAHKAWMQTSIWSDAGKEARRRLRAATRKLRANP